jgi:hypothetical protein
MKARLWQKPSSVPSTNPTTPVSPPITGNNSGATSPPLVQQQQQQQSMQTYQNSTFVPQLQQAPPPPPQYSSHPQQQQFNQQQIPQQQQQQHAPVYMQATANAHPNQTSILGNIQPQTNNYRHPMHSSVAPPPQHVAAQFSATNQTQHPTSMEHAQVLQHLRMAYPSYPTNTPFDRTTWSAPHPQSVQTSQPTLSFATTAQQANMVPYPGSIHQQPQFIPANVN